MPTPSPPSILLTGDSLISNAPFGNQWYNLTTGLINGAIGQSYKPDQNGYYYARINLTGCISDSSNNIYYNTTGINESLSCQGISIQPNPNTGTFYISSDTKIETMVITDCKGQEIFRAKAVNAGILPLELNVSKGLYLIHLITSSQGVFSKKMIIH
jgi:hypothetical protein